MNRRNFLHRSVAALAGLPLVGKLFAEKPLSNRNVATAFMPIVKRDGKFGVALADLCPLCEEPMSNEGRLSWGPPAGIPNKQLTLEETFSVEHCAHTAVPRRPVSGIQMGINRLELDRSISQLRRRREMERDIQSEAFLHKPTSGIHLTMQQDNFNRAAHKVAQIDTVIARVEALL